jgi:hypothetical protein
MVVVMTMVMVVMRSGKCWDSKGNQKKCSAKLFHGQTVARKVGVRVPIENRRIKTANGHRPHPHGLRLGRKLGLR